MAAERLSAPTVDGAADIWLVGCASHCLTALTRISVSKLRDYAALRLDFNITAGEAESATRASNGAHAGGPRCMALQRGPQRFRLHPHHPLGVPLDYP